MQFLCYYKDFLCKFVIMHTYIYMYITSVKLHVFYVCCVTTCNYV